MRTIITNVDAFEVEDTLEYYAHDSMFALKRWSYDEQEALDRKIIKSLEEVGKPDNGKLNPFLKANSYPCNTGLIVKETQSNAALGFTFSHGLMCHLYAKNAWQLMLTRAPQNPNF